MTIPRTSFLQRIMKYCAASERCTHDVLTKIEIWGVPSEEIGDMLKKLYSEKFIDDNRFALSYVSEKWNLDRWGKIKIANSLQQKNIDIKIIYEALKSIDDEEYVQGLHELLSKKLKEVRSKNKMDAARRVLMFALSRGFEVELIHEWLEKEGFGGMPET